MGWTSPQQLLHDILDLDARQAANPGQQQVWPVDGCLCPLALTRRSDRPPRCLPHQSLSFLSCCQLPLSFCDCTSSGRSQAPSQLPSSWDSHPLPPAMVGAGDHVLWHVPIIVLTLTISCSFMQCPGAHSVSCSRPVATSAP